MDINSSEHDELMKRFEHYSCGKFHPDVEDVSLWRKDIIYQNGELNRLFLAFRSGYEFAKEKLNERV